MKKYWKLIVFTCVTFLTLGTFYVKNITYSEALPQFTVQTLEGDEAIAESLTVYGQNYDGMFDMEELRVSQEGTDYFRDETYFKRLEGFYSLPQIEEWRNDYRGFMRGKDEYTGKFYEGKGRLVYASAISSTMSWVTDTFDMHILDKTTKEEQHFQVQIPNDATYWDVDVQFVYMIDNELTLITLNNYDVDEESSGTEAQRYTFDLGTEQLVEEETIYQAGTQMDDELYEDIALHTSGQDPDHVVITKHQINHEYDEAVEEEMVETTTISELIKYNVKTNESETMDIPNEVNGTFATFDQDKLYFADVTSPNVRIIPFHYGNQVVEDAWEVDVRQPEDPFWANGAVVQGDYLYFLNETYDGVHLPTIFVLNFKQEQLAFLGELVVNDPDLDVEDIFFERLEIE